MTRTPLRQSTGSARALGRSTTFLGILATLYAAVVLTAAGQAWDAASMSSFPGLRDLSGATGWPVRDGVTAAVLASALVALAEAAWRRRWRSVLAATALIGATALSSRLLKDILPRPALGEYGYAYQTFPSGHAAVCLAAAVAIVWLAPRWVRPWVIALLGAVTLFVALESLVSSAHRASDVIAGVLLAGVLAEAVSACAGEGVARSRATRALGIIGIVGGVIALVAGLSGFASVGPVRSTAVGIAALASVAAIVVVVLAARRPLRTGGESRAGTQPAYHR